VRRFGSFPEFDLEFFHAHDNPLPEFPALMHVHEGIATGRHNLPPHKHLGFEICYFYAGKANWFADGKSYRLKPGDIYITKPGEVHGGHADPADPFHIFVLALDLSALPMAPLGSPLSTGSAKRNTRAKALPPPRKLNAGHDVSRAVSEAETFHSNFNALDQRVIAGGEGLEHIFRRILAELDAAPRSDRRSRALKTVLVQAMLVEVLVFVARCCAAHAERLQPENQPRLPQRRKFQELLNLLRSRLAEPPTLSEMAEFCKLSTAHFASTFKRETGVTPLEYVTRLRIDEAASRLSSARRVSVTDVALDLGFSSAQYFSIVFRRVKGCTPSQWQKMPR
jgi:AraC-like DNA-binding protein